MKSPPENPLVVVSLLRVTTTFEIVPLRDGMVRVKGYGVDCAFGPPTGISALAAVHVVVFETVLHV
jgi:hypothetical protein